MDASRPAKLWARSLAKKYEQSQDGAAVDRIDLDVEPGEFLTLLGPSGCGKSTTLRMLMGLERPTAGEIGIGDEVLSSTSGGVWVPPNERNFGIVFQTYAIWPHMSVKENVAFPLRVRRVKKAQVDAAVGAALERVGMASLMDRPARRLSGGQQQRVAIARALVQQPRVLLLDEPLSNLDAALRRQMRTELKQLQRELHMTTVYVTHDQTEAYSMSDRVVVMNAGRIEQVDAPQRLYEYPETAFVATFLGAGNVLPARVVSRSERTVAVADQETTRHLEVARDLDEGCVEGVVVCHPDRLQFTSADGANVLAVHVTSVAYLGDRWEITCRVGPSTLRVTQRTTPDVDAGSRALVRIPQADLRFVDGRSTARAEKAASVVPVDAPAYAP